MKKTDIAFNKKKWMEEGFILQTSRKDYLLGQGPFAYHSKPCPQSLYHPDFFLTRKKPWIKASVIESFNKKELSDFLFDSKRDGFPLIPNDQSQKIKERFFEKTSALDNVNLSGRDFMKPSFIHYQELFCQARQAIQKGVFQKLVPALAESFTLDRNLVLWIQKLFKNTQKFSHGFLYGFWEKDRGLLGFTPEILFTLQGTHFSTMALAGTSPYPGPSLLKDLKERKEHNLVVQNLQESLEGLIKWKKQKTFEIKFPPLKHLYTKFEGELRKTFDFEKICQGLHPTSALGGYPQRSAFQWLRQQPLQKDRVFFGAPFGHFDSPEKAFCLVALRALEWKGNQVQIFSGGGLIKESLLQKEWQELLLKRQQVKTFFDIERK